MIRAPICAVVGHVDHGKTTLLDTLRGTAVAAREAGKITQAIGASIIPVEHIVERAKHLLGNTQLTIPGLLFIDTPGHAAFTGMRKRGGSLADIAVLIVDINEGFKPQTREALDILRSYKTPFVVAANKLDLARGYTKKDEHLLKDLSMQTPETTQYIETKLYELVGVLSEHGVPAERFDRVESFDKHVAIVPISAEHKQGIDALLAVIVGLAQKYLEDTLHAEKQGPAKGAILEVAEDKGLGLTLNAILYDGTLDVGDTIVVGSSREPVVTKVRALFQPSAMGDIRDTKTKFVSIQKATAATGVKVSAPGLEGVTAGMQLIEVTTSVEETKKELAKDASEVQLETEEEGIVLKADTIGSLEAIIMLLREKNIPIRAATVGEITKKDLTIAASNKPELAVIVGFNVNEPAQNEEGVPVITSDIIYKLIDDLEEFQTKVLESQKSAALEKLVRPAKIEVLPGHIFRASKPLVCGVHVQQGVLTRGAKLVSEKDVLNTVGRVKEIQHEKSQVQKATQGMRVAISIPEAVAERHINEGDVLLTSITEDDFRMLKEHKKQLTQDEISLLKDYAEKMRDHNPMWGV